MNRESIQNVPPIVLAHRVVYCSLRLVPLVLFIGFIWPFLTRPWTKEHKRYLDRLGTKVEQAGTMEERDRYVREYKETKDAGPGEGSFRCMVASSHMVRALKHLLWAGPALYFILWHILGAPFLRTPFVGSLIRFFCAPAVSAAQ